MSMQLGGGHFNCTKPLPHVDATMPGDTHIVVLFSLKNGQYFEGIAVKSKSQMGMVRAIFNKLKPKIEQLLP